ncbi:MAG: DUF1732 domain-containing protein [Candidatus Cloacimonetes bacterium]|nr:DUF1732 domain-containing protein [Candidatus Cloacimonadota bacterium]
MKLKKYNTLVKEAIDTLELTQDVPLEFLINEPGVLESNNSFADDLQLKEIVSESIELAIADFKDSTIKEGQEIRLVLEESLSLISNALSSIEASLDDYRALLYENMKKRILELTSNLGFENLEQRILQELAIYIDKYDIQEEITRLWTHLETFRHNLSKADDQEVGKTLNFIVQEMHREANTMGSKYSTSNSFKYILTIKEEIEKCKEIVQNVA